MGINSLSFEEIKDGDHFEDLVAAYFEELKNDKENNISSVKIDQSGVGPDGGRDILIEFEIYDEIKVFNRKWVIQCKFHDENIAPSKINQINIPTLIHSYNASGYLLVCRKRPTSGLTDLFERLNRDCKNSYSYEFWSGNQFIKKLRLMDSLHQTFFPEYFQFLISKSEIK